MGAEIIDGGEGKADQDPVDDPDLTPLPLRKQGKDQEGGSQDETDEGCAIDRGVDRELRPVERIERQSGADRRGKPGLPAGEAPSPARFAVDCQLVELVLIENRCFRCRPRHRPPQPAVTPRLL